MQRETTVDDRSSCTVMSVVDLWGVLFFFSFLFARGGGGLKGGGISPLSASCACVRGEEGEGSAPPGAHVSTSRPPLSPLVLGGGERGVAREA